MILFLSSVVLYSLAGNIGAEQQEWGAKIIKLSISSFSAGYGNSSNVLLPVSSS